MSSELTDHLLASEEEALTCLARNRYRLTERVGTKTKGKNRRVRGFYVHASVGMPVTDTTFLPCFSSIEVSYDEAVKLVKSLCNPARLERGAKVKISVGDYCVFLGC